MPLGSHHLEDMSLGRVHYDYGCVPKDMLGIGFDLPNAVSNTQKRAYGCGNVSTGGEREGTC